MLFVQTVYYPSYKQEFFVDPRPELWRVIGSATVVRYLGASPLPEEYIAYARALGWEYDAERKTFYPSR